MGDGTKESSFTREDIRELIKKNGGTARGLNLSGKQFIERIDLSGLDLSGIKLDNVRLFRAIFNGSILDAATMRLTDLGYATFNPLNATVASLQGVDFRGADLHDAEFKEARLTAAQFQKTLGQADALESLPASLERTDFRGANLFLVNFTGCYFYGTKLEGAYIRGADITLGDTHLGDVDWGNYKIGEEIGEGTKKNLYAAEHRYRQLKQWYNESGYYDIAAKFYYREKEASRKSLKLFSKSWNDRIASQLSFWVFGHGEGWKRILFWIAGIVFLFAIIYFSLGSLKPNTFWDCLYYSAVSFVAVGYGGWVKEATGWAKGLGVAETFLGFFMMTLLLVTFVRKWTR